MATCSICDGIIGGSTECKPHKVLLTDGNVVEEPEFDPGEDEFRTPGNKCHDCGVSVGEVHHATCENSHLPDWGQILINSVTYFDPDSDTDPRCSESRYIFMVICNDNGEVSDHRVLSVYDSLSGAKGFIEEDDYWGEADNVELNIEAQKLKSEVQQPGNFSGGE